MQARKNYWKKAIELWNRIKLLKKIQSPSCYWSINLRKNRMLRKKKKKTNSKYIRRSKARIIPKLKNMAFGMEESKVSVDIGAKEGSIIRT